MQILLKGVAIFFIQEKRELSFTTYLQNALNLKIFLLDNIVSKYTPTYTHIHIYILDATPIAIIESHLLLVLPYIAFRCKMFCVTTLQLQCDK